VHARKQPKADR